MHNRRILVIDDDPDILSSYQNILSPSMRRVSGSSEKMNRLLAVDDEDNWNFDPE